MLKDIFEKYYFGGNYNCAEIKEESNDVLELTRCMIFILAHLPRLTRNIPAKDMF